MRISDFSIQNPVKVAVGVILVWLFGLIALFQIPVQLTPEVTRPLLSVQTRWPGASPQEVEKEIVSKQEEQLQNVEGMIDFRSECYEGFGIVEMEFEVGTDVNAALVRVNKLLSQVRDYPLEAQEPTVRTVSMNSSAICWTALIAAPPTQAEIDAFLQAHPELREPLASLWSRSQIDMQTLLHYVEEYPALEELTRHKPDPSKLQTFAEDNIAARLRRVDGVAGSDVYGGREEELRVIVDPARLAARKISITELRDALEGENKDVSGGDVWEGKSRYLVRTLGLFDSPEQVASVVVAYRDGAPVYVRDVAEVRVESTKPRGVGRQRGTNSLSINVQRQEGANVLEIMKGVRREIESLNETVLKPRNLELILVYDETVYIDSATQLVRSNIFVGGTLAALVLLIFLRNGRSTLIVVLAIPISAIGTFLVVRLLGRSINVISLAGMAFAIGMVVDSAIVVLENIYTHFQRGATPFQAASRGTSEVWGAILASTLTTLAVFLPVVFIEEEAGQLFRDISIAISAGVSISLLVSLTVIPSAASQLLRHQDDPVPAWWQRIADRMGVITRPLHRFSDRLTAWGSRFVVAVVGLTETLQAGELKPATLRLLAVLFTLGALALTPMHYEPIQTWPWWYPVPSVAGVTVALLLGAAFLVLSARTKRLAVVLTMMTLAVGLSYRLMPEAEYLPTGNKNLVFARVQPPPGYNIDQMTLLGKQVEERLRPYWEAEPGSEEEARLDGPGIDSLFMVMRGSSLFMGARAREPQRAAELVPVLRRATEGLPGAISFVNQSSLFERGSRGGRSIDIEITGPDLERLIELGTRIMNRAQEIFPSETETSIRPIPSLDMGSPELHVRVNREKAAQRGVRTVDLGYTISALVDGAYAGTYWHHEKEIDLVIYGDERYNRRTQNVGEFPIVTPTGEVIRVADVADVFLSSGPEQINRIDRERALTIQVSPGPTISLEGAMNRIRNDILEPIILEGELPPMYQFRLAGTADNLNQMRSAMAGGLILALVITYLLIAGLYESFLYPLVIMISVPMAAVGGFLGLRLLNLVTIQRLDTLTMLGFVILIGTVVNNAILIVDQALVYIRRDGADHRDAIRESVRGRVRPIFMATLTTLLGMLPLVVFPGAGSELYRGLGSVILGGLLLSTVFTLFLVPLLFSLAFELRSMIMGHGAVTLADAARLQGPTPLETSPSGTNGHGSDHETTSRPPSEINLS